jgi:hypothetical protein
MASAEDLKKEEKNTEMRKSKELVVTKLKS